MEKQRLSIVVKQNNLFKKMIFVLSLLIILISILLAVFGVKYNKTKQNLKTVAAQKAAVEQSLSERESLFADEKGSLNGEISKLNEQVSLKREQESRALAEANAGKVVYLTFDDGGKYNGYMKNITESGNQIALHSYSHDYPQVYASEQAFFDDLQKISDLVYNETGVRTNIFRFPGGSSNTISRKYSPGIMTTLTKEVQEKGYCYFDWNVSSGDSESREQPKNTIIENCKKVPKSNTIVVLMHDSAVKNTTVEALPEIIAYYKSMGYSFGVLSEKTYPVHQKVNN